MAKLVFGMNMSLDGYVDHDHAAFVPDAALFQHFIALTRGLAGSIYGRGLYDVMRYWDEDHPEWDAPEREFAIAWRRQPKWVVSRSLRSVGPNATLVGEDFAAVICGLKTDREGTLYVGGPKLAASLAQLGLLDAYEIYLRPVVMGGGSPYFAGARPALRLVASDRVGEDALRLTYVPA